MHNNAHPWRIMVLILGGVLLSSWGLDRLTAPAGTALIAAMDARPVTVTGTIEARAEKDSPVLCSAGTVYTLSDASKLLPWTGRQVRVRGVFHESTGVLEIHSIDAASGRS